MANELDIISTACRYRMFSQGDTVLVAVSGGPDSVAMLHALHACSQALGISLVVAHLDHGLRSEASDMDAEFVRELARSYGLKSIVEKVSGLAGDEESAREARYAFLRRAAAQAGANKIAVGHTADDRAESVLLNIIRGTGIDGLGSIRPVRGNVVRPLIDAFRTEIEAYIQRHGLPFRVDETNQDIAYARNRIRHELLPALEESYSPQVKSALVRLAGIAADQSDLMASLAESASGQVAYRGSMDADLVLRLPKAVQFQLVRSRLLALKGDLRDVTLEQVERVLDALACGKSFKITLPSGTIYAARAGCEFLIESGKLRQPIKAFDYDLALPGETVVPELGLTVQSDVIRSVENLVISPKLALIDAKAIVGKLRVRNARPGDRITPFGMTGAKKLQDLFVDKKIPRAQRAAAALVVDDEKILWVVGVAASEATRITKKTARIIRLRAVTDR